MITNVMARIAKKLLVAVGLLFMIPQDSNAYLDLGTGSYMLQVILATLLASLFFVKRFWLRIISFFRTIFSREK